MKNKLAEIKKFLDFESIQQTAFELAEVEKSSSYDDFARSAEFCAAKLQQAGFSDVRKIVHQADGKSTAFDCTMPQAWSLDHNRRSFLEVCGDTLPECGRILADSNIQPLHANIWSSPTPDGGVTAELVTFESLNGDLSAARGKWVLYAPEDRPVRFIGGLYRDLAEAGIAGLVCCNMVNADVMPYDIEWFNGNGLNSWYLIAGEKRFTTFSVTPLVARALRKQLALGKMELHGEMYCRVYDGEISTVTALIPGESSEEFALIAHLYEPFVNDDATGFAHLCEFGRQLIQRQVKLKKSLRVIFSMELYGVAAYLQKYGQNVILAANFDGLPFLETNDILVRRVPFFRAHFTDFLNLDILKKHLPPEKLFPEPGNLSDDTFCNDPYFGGGIPTFWLHNSFERGHHNTGFLFATDWLAAKEYIPVFALLLETILCADKLPDYSVRAAKEFTASARNILADKELSSYEKQIRIKVEYLRNRSRLESVTAYTGQAVDFTALETAWAKYSAQAAALPAQEFSAAEYRALYLTVTRGDKGYPFSLSTLPPEARRKLNIHRVLWCAFDGKRSLLECIRMSDAELGVRTPDKLIPVIISDLQLAAKYGYAALQKAPAITGDDFAAALRELGVTPGMKLVVHSTFSSLGQIEGGPEICCKKLQEQLGTEGTLMMPAFSFQVYLPGSLKECYDVRNTPSKVGILTETFRKMPGVYRSFDPCHSFAVWGKDAVKYVENHHRVPTIDPQHSPLGMFFAENGYVMTISSADSVTFMHLVEELSGARCCSKRGEEYRTILPDGSEVKTRAWGWRATTCPDCPAHRTEEIFAYIRKYGTLREVMLNHASLKLFSMEDYFRAYRALMKKSCRNAAKPRRVECTVKSDWDEKKRQLKKSDAYTGAWMPDKD